MSRFWGVLVVVDILIATSIGTLTAYIVGALIGGLFIVLAKAARADEIKTAQTRRDKTADELKKKLLADNPSETKVDNEADRGNQ